MSDTKIDIDLDVAQADAALPAVWKGRRVRVTRLLDIAAGVREVQLEPADGAPFPPWEPGSHVDIDAGGMCRQYSLVSSHEDRSQLRIAVRLAENSRGGSRWVHENLAVGDELVLEAVRNNFAFRDAPGYVFLAGGIGVTPLISMMRTADEQRRDWKLFYGGRTQDSLPYVSELTSWRGGHVTTVTEEADGFLNLAAIVEQTPADHLIYACGPPAMLVDLRKVCADTDTDDRLHVESFSPLLEEVSSADDEPFEVICARRNGLTIRVDPDVTILEALEQAGLRPEYGCREGTCGTCEVAVLDGAPDHRDSVLTDTERAAGDCLMICVSRSTTPQLLIDL
ncbi:PDR/VanB family oxidoreductase [Rhodococcus olei]|uniref:PDR/VanB family oxidoreductase n=1 Tax=Rhodococcus olei TaxID=2161675 RepID=A0ABP8NWL8_9NOCA